MADKINFLTTSLVKTDIPALLKEVAFTIGTLREARRRYSAQLAPDFNLFNFLRNDEMGLSSAIADLLNPKGSHGQGAVFLDSFVAKLGTDYDWIADNDDWNVTTEKTLPDQRRLDIYMESQTGLLAIENKPWASDQGKQLEDYASFLKKYSANRPWLLIYLGNAEPDENSIGKEKREEYKQSKNLLCISFYFLVEWLGECAARAKALPVRVFIEELAKYVRFEINGDMEMSEQSEVISEICKTPENIQGAFHISNAMNAMKNKLLEKFRRELEHACNQHKYEVMWDPGMNGVWGKDTGFGLKFEADHHLYLRIEFAQPNLGCAEWGICRTGEDIPRDEQVWKMIQEKMGIQFGVGKSSDWWPWYSSARPRMKFGHEFEDWNHSATPWIEMDNGKLVKRIVDLADETKNALSDTNGLDILLPSVRVAGSAERPLS